MTLSPDHPQLAALYGLWRTKVGGRRMPARADFDATELAPWFGHLLLVETIGDGEDFRFRLHGTMLGEMFGFDLTGKTVREAVPFIGEKARDEYLQVCASGEPLLVQRGQPFAKQFMLLDKLALPLSDDGRRVDRIMAAIYASPASEVTRGT
jgi:hypothetical protein